MDTRFNQIMSFTLNDALEELKAAQYDLEEHENNETVGIEYTTEDKYRWSMATHEISKDIEFLKKRVNDLLSEQLNAYFKYTQMTNWNKKEACNLLRQALDKQENPSITVSVKDLFVLLGNSSFSVPPRLKEQMFNDFAYKLEEWYSVERDVLRTAMSYSGFKLEEICVHCNELMPEFEGTGNPVCNECS
jgi:glutamate synthase domain-containing protein 2